MAKRQTKKGPQCGEVRLVVIWEDELRLAAQAITDLCKWHDVKDTDRDDAWKARNRELTENLFAACVGAFGVGNVRDDAVLILGSKGEHLRRLRKHHGGPEGGDHAS